MRLALFAFCFLSAYGQTPPPKFEVASIKPGGDLVSTRPPQPSGRFTWTTQLSYLIGYAYGVDFSRVSGQGVGAVYSVDAVTDPDATDSAVRMMVQSLLIERFNLRLHPVTTEADGYFISVGKGGIKFKESSNESEPGDEGKSAPRGYVSASFARSDGVTDMKGVMQIEAKRGSLSQLVDTLARTLRTPVWDETKLQGIYDFTFRFSEDLNPDSAANAPSLPTALRDSLGLTLQKGRGSVQKLVVDHLEAPSEN